MTTYLEMIDQELADTLEAVRMRRGLPPFDKPASLARDIVGKPSPPKTGCCVFCGGPAPAATVCAAHSDLVDLDVQTNGTLRSTCPGSAEGASKEKNR